MRRVSAGPTLSEEPITILRKYVLQEKKPDPPHIVNREDAHKDSTRNHELSVKSMKMTKSTTTTTAKARKHAGQCGAVKTTDASCFQ